ncbi:MAG: DUF2520 domain-containing protein [Cytophagales bacterium]|nr:MAG: DUF2520 domain-containing protein [Cytophagales bacterium]
MKISVIGAGNVAWHIAQTLEKNGHTLLEVYSKGLDSAEKLSRYLKCAQATNDLNFSKSKATFFIIAVADDALAEVAQKIILPPEAIVVHTSGSQPMDILRRTQATEWGVLYPLQTFSREKEVDFSKIMFCLEANSPEALSQIQEVAQSLSVHVRLINSQQRKVLHIAAVFACNFANHVWAIAENILARENIKFDVLQPLIAETMQKAFTLSPSKAQTGPAKRGDKQIIEQHLAYLAPHEAERHIYQVLSQSIAQKKD